ncbi:hypothetical protein HK104_008333 [Borealophlyctis nickersoniae]|nr:hypothetical protein HK104_008333 [Borealophlyctis nickersoniae]
MHVGMGNRLPAIITGLFLAMTLNRTLVVEYDGFAELFEPEIDVVLKKEVREAIKIAAEEWADREDDLDELRRNGTNGIDANATGEAVPSMELPLIGAPGIRTKPPQNKHQNLRTWLTADFVNGQPWSRVPFLWFRTMDYGTPLLESNPHFKPWFDKTFDVSSSNGLGTHHPFHAAAKRMLRLKPHLQKEVDTFVKEHFDGAGLVVGLQLRTKKFSWSFPKLQLYVDVAKMIARTRLRGMREVKEVNRTVVLTNATASSPNDSSTIATTKTSTITTKTGNVRFFVATDDLATTNKIISLLHPYEAFSTSPTSLSNADRNNNPGTDSAAVIDMRLLSLCDELVVTFGSSFGFVASAWGGVPPHVIMHGKHDGWDKPVFWGSGGVSEPCMFEGRTVGKLGGEAERLWKESPNWVYHSQCHW